MTNQSALTYQTKQDLPLPCTYRYRFVLVMIAKLICFFTASCVEEFHPWEENEQYHFTIYGYLDASADTQWVRIMPIREELLLEAGPNNITVTLEHVETGETVAMNDSLFSFAQGAYAWNFWTTMDLHPEQTYRLTAVSSEGLVSGAQVTLPAEYPSPLVTIEYTSTTPQRPTYATVFLEGVERLADVRTVHGRIRIAHLQDTVRLAPDYIRIAIDLREDLQVLGTLYPDVSPNLLIGPSAKIFIAAAGPDYHHFGSVSEKVISLPEGVSNIEDGIGYLAGIVSKTIPLASCKTEDNQNIIPCEPEPPPW